MKVKKGSLFFLFLCLMGVLTVSAPISPLHHDSIGVVYAEEDNEEEEEDTPAPATGSNGNYENLQVPSILSTAYADGLRLAELDDSDTEDSAAAVFRENMKLLINNPDTANKYQFDTIGVFMGPIGQSSGSGTNDVATTLSIGLPQLQSDYNFDNDLGEAYWTFGRAVQNLRNDASKADTSSINATAAIDALAGISTQVANIGIRLLSDWSPAPVVLAFMDSDVLHQAEYQSNQLIKMVHRFETAYNIVNFFGNSVPGIPELSYSQLITLMIIMLSLVLSILTIFIGDKLFPKTVKRTFVKVLVMLIAVPLTMHLYDWGLQTLDAVAGAETQTTEYQQARSHLLLGQWAERGFAVPAGRTLTVQDGRFILSRDDIRAINGMLVGADEDDHQKVADEITRQVAADNNETNISWQALMLEDGSRPWRTARLIEMADAIGNGQPVADNTGANLADNAVGYLYGSGLRASKGTNGNFRYTQNGAHIDTNPYTRFGIGPVANYNLLNTSFNTNSLSVKSNLSTGSSLPSVAPTAYAYNIGGVGAGTGEVDKKMNGPVKWLVEFTLMMASIKALAKILTTGFGGMLGGGVRSMFGSSAGWGELIGAVFAAIFGVIGLSLFSLLALQITSVLYGSLHTMTSDLMGVTGTSSALSKAVGDFLKPTGWLSKIPVVSGFIADMISNGIASLLSTVMAFLMGIFLLPNFVKIPIEAFAAWISALPSMLAQKAQAIENEFTGSYRSGGGPTGALSGAVDKAGEGMLNKGTAVAAGAGMIAGAAVKAGGGAIANKIGEKLGGKGKDGVGDGEDTKKESESVAEPNTGETDANGNPITENVSDSEETSADENNQEGDAVGGDTESDETITSDDDRTEGDAIDGDTDSDETVTSDDDRTEGDAIDGDVNAEDSVASDDSAVEGDVNADDSVASDDSAVEGDVNAEDSVASDDSAVEGDVNADDSVASDDSAVEGDVNAEDSSVIDEIDTQGDINDDRSAVDGDVNAEDSSVNDESNAQGDINDDRSDVDGDVNAEDSSVTGGTNTSNSSAAGGTNTSNSSVAGGTNTSNSSAAGGTNTSNSSVAGGTNTSNSSVAGGTSTNSSSAKGDAVGGDVNTSDSSEGSSNIGGDTSTTGDVNTNDSTVGSEGSGQGPSVSDGSADSGTNDGGTPITNDGGTPITNDGGTPTTNDGGTPTTNDGGTPITNDGGTSVTNDASTEGAQVSNDTTIADANVSQDASASINQSTEDRTMHQEGNADNSQSADVNSNSQTVNDSQSTVAGDSPTTGTGAQGSATSTGAQGSATSTGKQGTGKQGTGKQGSATSTGKQGSATQGTGKQGSAAQGTGKQGTGKQGTGKQGTGKQGSATQGTGKQGSATQGTGKQGSATPQGGKGTPQGGKGTPQGGKGTAKIDSKGTVTSSKQGTSNQGSQSKGGNESTSAKAGRLGRMFKSAKNITATKGEVSNAQQAAMGAVHIMGGLTGTQNITQAGVDNIKRRQGQDVDAKNGGNNAGQNASNSPDNEHHQQIIDRQRREEEERDERRKNKKPSFIQNIRNNKNSEH